MCRLCHTRKARRRHSPVARLLVHHSEWVGREVEPIVDDLHAAGVVVISGGGAAMYAMLQKMQGRLI